MQALERAMAELVLGRDEPRDRSAVDAWLERSGVSAEDAAAIRGEAERLLVYRRLVRGRLREAVGLALPRSIARLGPLFDEYFERYLADRGPRTHYLRDVTTEFLEFVGPHMTKDVRVPPWALDLARHEALDIVVGSLAEPPAAGLLPELDPDRGLAFSPTARVVRYTFAVHRLSADPDDRGEPEASPTSLFVYRSPEHDVRYLELTPLAAAIVERLLEGATLREAVERAGRELGVALDAGALEGTARLLSDLAARGAVAGAREAKNATGDLQNPRPSAENGGERGFGTPKRTG